MTLVTDVNVVLKWFSSVNEEDVTAARHLYQQLQLGKIEVYAPSSLLIEVANIFLHKKHFSEKEVKESLERIQNSGIHFVDFSAENMDKLIELCDHHQLTTHDGLYLLLAQEKKSYLITTDEQLLKVKRTCLSLKEWVNSSLAG